MTTKQNSATGVTRWLGIAVALAVANSATAATTTATSWNTVNTVGQSTVTFNGGQVSTSLPYPGFPTPVRVELAAQATIGSFAGDYRRAGVQALNLTLACNTTPVNAFIMLYGNSGRLWATSALTNGANSISFDREAGGWALYGAGADLPTLWNEDLNNVASLGVLTMYVGNPDAGMPDPETLTVSGFELIGTQTVGSLPTTLADALMAAFGVNTVAGVDPLLGNADDDGDGMSNLDEVRAEYEAGYFEQVLFKAELSSDGSSVTIKFACVNGDQYTIGKAASVGGAYGPINGNGVVDATFTGYTNRVDSAAGPGPNFYRVLKQ